MSTRTTGGRNAATTAGRFGRTAAQQPARAGRGAATRGRTPAQSSGRFGRSLSLQQASSPKRASSTRGLPLMSRKPQQKKSGLGGALSALTSALPSGGAAAAAKRGGTKPAGFALAAAAAGMAFRNRDKLAGMLGRGKQQQQLDPVVPGQPQPTPPAV